MKNPFSSQVSLHTYISAVTLYFIWLLNQQFIIAAGWHRCIAPSPRMANAYQCSTPVGSDALYFYLGLGLKPSLGQREVPTWLHLGLSYFFCFRFFFPQGPPSPFSLSFKATHLQGHLILSENLSPVKTLMG